MHLDEDSILTGEKADIISLLFTLHCFLLKIGRKCKEQSLTGQLDSPLLSVSFSFLFLSLPDKGSRGLCRVFLWSKEIVEKEWGIERGGERLGCGRGGGGRKGRGLGSHSHWRHLA